MTGCPVKDWRTDCCYSAFNDHMMHGGPGSAHQVDLQEQKVTTHVSPNLSKLVRNCALPQTFIL